MMQYNPPALLITTIDSGRTLGGHMRGRLIAPVLVAHLLIGVVHVRADIPIRTQVLTPANRPLFVTQAPGDDSRLFIVEQGNAGTLGNPNTARIKIWDFTANNGAGALLSTPFLTISGDLAIPDTIGPEQGLLGLAFHPNYQTNGLFYITMTAIGGTNGLNQVREYHRATASTADPSSMRIVLSMDDPQITHNVGWVAFGPKDGYLYVGSGDGGSANDMGPGHNPDIGNAQDITDNLFGKILRVDVDGGDDFPNDPNKNYRIPPSNPFVGQTGDDEIWHYGLRNPWRDSFDRATGDLYIGDVGQMRTEEIDFHQHGTPAGLNYGWRVYEGTQPRVTPIPPGEVITNHTPPIYEYSHGVGVAVIGGYVYRGDENPALQGTYFFCDYITDRVFTFKYDPVTGQKNNFREITSMIGVDAISSFGEDNRGRLYVTDLGGRVYRVIPALGGDANLSGVTNVDDLGVLASHWQMQSGATWAMGDFTDDGKIDVADLGILATYWQKSASGPDLTQALGSYGLPTDVVPEPTAVLVASPLLLRRRTRTTAASAAPGA
jgi:glucose/arabinose dehydrogenase